MGTRARINIIENGKTLVSIYRQYDGYVDGLGKEVAFFLSGLSLVNGLPGGNRNGLANGMGCLAAQLIKALKGEAGNVYLRDTGPESNGEEYVYTVYQKGEGRLSRIFMRTSGGSMTAFGMPGDEESAMVTLFDGPVSAYSTLTKEDIENAEAEAIDKASRRKTARKRKQSVN